MKSWSWALAVVAVIGLSAGRARGDELAVNGSRLYYDLQGSGPPLILLHGGNLDSGMWDDDVPVFAKTWRVVRMDQRPYGRSGPAADGYSNVEDLRALLDHLKIAKAHLVGLSLGGRTAIDFTLTYPARVDRLVLAGPGLTGYDWPEDPSLAAMFAAAKAGDAAQAMALWLKHPYMAPAMEQPAVAAKIRVLSQRNEKIWTHAPVKQQYPDPPAMTRLAQIKAPTLLILGQRDVPDIHKIIDILAKQIGGARLVTVPRAGHMVNMEAPSEFRRAVVDFLKQAR